MRGREEGGSTKKESITDLLLIKAIVMDFIISVRKLRGERRGEEEGIGRRRGGEVKRERDKDIGLQISIVVIK